MICGAEERVNHGIADWISFAANLEASRHDTQFFEPHHDANVGSWDSRLEIWLPPYREAGAYGPYIRFSGIKANKPDAWENVFLAAPGCGFQIFPFSFKSLKGEDQSFRFLGPLRLYGEYNRQDYWGEENSWRPRFQKKAGADYWLDWHGNDYRYSWWAEIWGGIWWQSANEYDGHYNTSFGALNVRTGLRVPSAERLSWFTPYLVMDSTSSSKHTSYWENRFQLGGGLRIVPDLAKKEAALTRCFIFVENIRTCSYYHTQGPSSIPRTDHRFGIGATIGSWFYQP